MRRPLSPHALADAWLPLRRPPLWPAYCLRRLPAPSEVRTPKSPHPPKTAAPRAVRRHRRWHRSDDGCGRVCGNESEAACAGDQVRCRLDSVECRSMHRTVRRLILLRVGRLVPSKARSVPQHASNNRNSERVGATYTASAPTQKPKIPSCVLYQKKTGEGFAITTGKMGVADLQAGGGGPEAERKCVAAASECITSGSSTIPVLSEQGQKVKVALLNVILLNRSRRMRTGLCLNVIKWLDEQ